MRQVPRTRTVPLAAALTLAAATACGCTNGDASPDRDRPRALTSPTCRTYTRTGQRIGITIPPGFTIHDTIDYVGPGSTPNFTYTLENLLSQATLPAPSGGTSLNALISLFSYGPHDLRDVEAIDRAVGIANTETGGTGIDPPATPTTIAGLPGKTGTFTDPDALTKNNPATTPAVVRYWLLNTADTQIIIVLISRTPDLDNRYTPQILTGLHPGGCP